MTFEPAPPRPPATASDRERAERAKEFIYGTIAVLIAMAGFDLAGGEPVAAGSIVLVSAVATWLAHAYSTVLGHRLTNRRPASRTEVAHALRESWPIVTAALPATLLATGASLGFWSLSTAIRAADLFGIIVLSGAGLMAGRAAGAGRLGIVVWVVATAGLGIAIVLVELAVHR